MYIPYHWVSTCDLCINIRNNRSSWIKTKIWLSITRIRNFNWFAQTFEAIAKISDYTKPVASQMYAGLHKFYYIEIEIIFYITLDNNDHNVLSYSLFSLIFLRSKRIIDRFYHILYIHICNICLIFLYV